MLELRARSSNMRLQFSLGNLPRSSLFRRCLSPHRLQTFSPGKVEQGASTYGFGWNIVDDGGNKTCDTKGIRRVSEHLSGGGLQIESRSSC
jgi:hypothetical protein